ncbi:M24 family metallopeptidase [Halomarina pelagica]|uniref:M24 family metallopeptidase n=1 Tax=Halomarina pelagica TaxID=2961599 RepID=UPI0020C2450D|nr:Xaa-Pro peptidase family protein [Halomarina sp. BND7]
MAPAYPRLRTHLDEAGTDGYLINADGEDSNQYYLSGFYAMSNFVTLYTDGEVRLLINDLEYPRASTGSDGDCVRRLSEFDYGSRVVEHGPTKAGPLATAAFLSEYGIDSVSVPPSFPNGTADVLHDRGVEVVTDYDDAVASIRAVKTDEEIERIEETQRANERAMAVAEGMLERATVDAGVLALDGEVLTSERVRRAIEVTLLEEECGLSDCIVASGAEGARAHAVGSGPIEAGKPVIVDIFPRNRESRYFADMTRTFVKGEPEAKIPEWYDVTLEAYETALETIRPGVTGEAVNEAVCDVFEREGYPTLRTDESTEDGFTSSTGHGVGLDIHERPKLSWGGGELRPGHVVTVEPGLYEQGTGGVRLEDLVVVTETGYENVTDYPRELGVL